MKIKTRKKNKPEKKIQNEILEWLTSKGYFFWRNNSAGLFDPSIGKFRRKGKYEVLGAGDILGLIDGRFISIEVKSKTGQVSENQKKFMEDINNNSGIAFVARGIADVERELFLL